MFLYRLLKSNSELIFLISMMIVVVSMPFSRFGLSVGQFSMLGIWLIDGRYKEKVRTLFSNQAALVLVSFYLLHVAGLLYTDDYDYAFKDLRVKLPLLFFPVVLATFRPLSVYRTNLLLLLYIASVLAASLISLWIYLFTEVSNFRELSPFISHIRLSLNACLAIFFTAYFAVKVVSGRKLLMVLSFILVIWLYLFLIMIESVTGLVIVWVVIYSVLIAGLFRFENLTLKITSLLLILAIPVFFITYFSNTVNRFVTPYKDDLKHLEAYTSHGNPYHHDTLTQPVENGGYVGLYVCEPELRAAWNGLSQIPYDSLDQRGQELRFTLIRYLNSKDLRKDSDGLSKLGRRDIRNIEMGIANVHYTRPISLNSRLYKLLWEYQVSELHGNPGGHSLAQRFEFWRVSLAIINDHMLIGVGTGDIVNAYADKYETLRSKLELQYRHRAHNQFLAIFVTFGIIGLAWFLFSLIYPGIKMKKMLRFRYFAFWVTLMLSMLVEDTLETQMGVTLFAFFNALLLFGITEEKPLLADR